MREANTCLRQQSEGTEVAGRKFVAKHLNSGNPFVQLLLFRGERCLCRQDSGGQKLAARSSHKRFTDYNMEQIDIHDEPRIEIIANACRSPAGLGLHYHVCIRSVNNKSASSGGVE